MKKSNIRLLILLLLVCLSFQRCQKDDQQTPSFVLSQKKVSSIREKLEKQHMFESFSKKINDSLTIVWEPLWDEVTTKTPSDTASFTYVPLKVKMMVKGTEIQAKLVNFISYLIVKNDQEYYFGDYYFEPEDKGEKPSTFRTDMKSFTGIAFLRNLSTNELYSLKYKNGIRDINAEKSAMNSSKKSDMATNGWERVCRTEYACDYWGVCENVFYYYRDPLRCDYPTASVGGYCDWANWNLGGSYPYEICEDVYFPDPPLPDPCPCLPGGGNPPPTPVTNNPCDVKSLISASETYKNTLNAAKNNWLKLDHESAYTFTNANDLNSYSFMYGITGQPFVRIPVSVPISGVVHTHPSGIFDSNNQPYDMLPTPSPGDIELISILLNSGKLSNPDTFTSVVITDLQTLYMITINDQNLFKTWAATNFQIASNQFTQFDNNFSITFDGLLQAGYNKVDAAETSLVNHLQNSGISLIRGDINNLYLSESWKPLIYNPSLERSQAIPCP